MFTRRTFLATATASALLPMLFVSDSVAIAPTDEERALRVLTDAVERSLAFARKCDRINGGSDEIELLLEPDKLAFAEATNLAQLQSLVSLHLRTAFIRLENECPAGVLFRGDKMFNSVECFCSLPLVLHESSPEIFAAIETLMPPNLKWRG